MCSSPHMPDPAPPPPPAPPPAEPSPVSPIINEGQKRSKGNKQRDANGNPLGVNGLRINLNIPQPGGNGLAVPKGS